MIDYQNNVYLELLKRAASGGTIVGSDLVSCTGIPKEEFNSALDNISRFCIENGLPVITCLVIQGNTGLPSQTFYSKFTNLEHKKSTLHEKRLLWINLVKKVYATKYPNALTLSGN